jgi:hypothetical protein
VPPRRGSGTADVHHQSVADAEHLVDAALATVAPLDRPLDLQTEQDRLITGYDLIDLRLHAGGELARQPAQDVGAAVARLGRVLGAAPAHVLVEQRAQRGQIAGLERSARARRNQFGVVVARGPGHEQPPDG